jgi:hypothetical protein
LDKDWKPREEVFYEPLPKKPETGRMKGRLGHEEDAEEASVAYPLSIFYKSDEEEEGSAL